MSMFAAIPISASGAEAMQTWIDTSAGNVANMNDVAAVGSKAYAAQTPILTPIAGGVSPTGPVPGEGVAVSRVALGTSKGVVTYDPTNPLANAQGDVVVPNISLADQMVGMIAAQESYSADTSMIVKAKTAYEAGLTIGS